MFVGVIAMLPMSAYASNQRYAYTIFGLDSVTINAPGINLNGAGNIGSGGVISVPSSFANSNRLVATDEGMMYVGNRIIATHFSGNNVENHNSDHTISGTNIHVNAPIKVNGNLTMNGGHINPSSNLAIMATGNVSLICETINANNNIIYSANGDINIQFPGSASLMGLVYAPHGNVTISAQGANLNGVIIIAKSVTINSNAVANINYSNSVAEFVGTESEVCDICNDDDVGGCVGGVIDPPLGTGLVGAHIINGNALRNGSAVLDIDVLDLISGTCIRADEIFGISATIWAPQANTRQIYVDINGVASPMFNTDTTNPDRIFLPREAVHPLTWEFSATQLAAIANSTDFTIRIRSNNAVFGVAPISLLGADGRVLGTATYSTQDPSGTWTAFVADCNCNVADDNCGDCGANPCECPDCRFGGRIESPTELNLVNFLNGNTPDGSRMSLDFSVLDLIEGTAIRANEIYGLAVVTWGPNTENRQATIEVNGVESPRFHGASEYNPERIWAIMECGNTPNNVSRTQEQRLIYMNRYASQNASDFVLIRPFVADENPANFDVRIRANNEHISMITEVILLGESGRALGGAIFSAENNAWSSLMAFVRCDECKLCIEQIGFVHLPSNLTYRFIGNRVRITGFASDDHPQNVVIPSRIGGVDVTEIGAFAFENRANLRSVTIPGSVELIGTGAFFNTGLESVTFLQGGVLTIQMLAFAYTPRLASVDFSERLHVVLQMLAFYESGLTSVIFGDSKQIYEGAFGNTALAGMFDDEDDNGNVGNNLSGNDFDSSDDSIERRLSVEAEYDTVNRIITVSWEPTLRVGGVEIPMATGSFEIFYSYDDIEYHSLATVQNVSEYSIVMCDEDFVFRYYRVVQTVGGDVVQSNDCYVIWSPPGVCSTEYVRSWTLDGDVLSLVNEVSPLSHSLDNDDDNVVSDWSENSAFLSRINVEGNPFTLSLAFRAAGNPSRHLMAMNSGYFYAMQNNLDEVNGWSSMVLGTAPELIYHENFVVESVTLNFQISDGNGDINRFHVFKWFDEINMSLPVETIDNGNVLVYTGDSFGAFALVDMEQWFAFLNANNTDNVNVTNYNASFNAIIGSSWEAIKLNAVPHPNSPVDTDQDGIRDWDELDTRGELNRRALFNWDSTGITKFPTIGDLLGVWGDTNLSSRFPNIIGNALSVEVLPIISNPARADSDGDGIPDIFDHCKDYIRTLMNGQSAGRLIPPDGVIGEDWFNEVYRWVNHVENYEYHRGPLWRDTVESMYLGYLYFSTDNVNRPNADGWLPRGGTAVRFIDGNTIELGFNINFTLRGFCGEGSSSEGGGYRISCSCVTLRMLESRDLVECSCADICEHEITRTLYRLAGAEDIDENDITFEQLAMAGIGFNLTTHFTGGIYDFFPGMAINTQVYFESRRENTWSGSPVGFSVFNHPGQATGSMGITMYTQHRCGTPHTPLSFAATSVHEMGHILDLFDSYGGGDTHSFELTCREDEVRFSGERRFLGHALMRDNGSAIPNDFEMILLAFAENKRQHYIPSGFPRTEFREQSRAIKSDVTYTHLYAPDVPLRWCPVAMRLIPVGVEIFKSEETNGYTWAFSMENGRAVIWGIVGGGRENFRQVSVPDEVRIRCTGVVYTFPVIKIADFAFYMDIIENITVPNTVTSIGNFAFANGRLLSTVTIPASVTSIGEGAFRNCIHLMRIIVESGNRNYESDSAGVLYRITNYGQRLIQYPRGRTATEYKIPTDGPISIADRAFEGNIHLRRVVIPGNVTDIGQSAFANLPNIVSVILSSTTPLEGLREAFHGSNPRVVYVPSASVDSYKNSFTRAWIAGVSFNNDGSFTIPNRTSTLCNVCYLLTDGGGCRCCLGCGKLWRECVCRCCNNDDCECCSCEDEYDECKAHCVDCKRLISVCRDNFRRNCIGDVMGAGEPTVQGAIQILRHLLDLPNIIGVCYCEIRCVPLSNCPTICEVTLFLTLITDDSIRLNAPTALSAIDILRWLLDLPTTLGEIWRKA
jgi:hypothetical protein